MTTADASTPRLRRATPADAAVIAHHRASMFHDMGTLPDQEVEPIARATRAQLEPLIASGEYLGWLAELDGSVVAGAGVFRHRLLPRHGNPEGLPEAYVLNVYTEPAFRRRGLARQLMDAIVAWCAEEGLPRLSLHASQFGRPMYESMGFRPSNEMRLDVPRREPA